MRGASLPRERERIKKKKKKMKDKANIADINLTQFSRMLIVAHLGSTLTSLHWANAKRRESGQKDKCKLIFVCTM